MDKITTSGTAAGAKKKEAGGQPKKDFFLKSWWNRYLKRLNKVTDGKPQCCK
jgi:hypothetical protein